MLLYHGSNVEVKAPRLLETQRALDFGKGFYTTGDLQQACNWARRTAVRRDSGCPCVSVYEVDEAAMNTLRVLQFQSADEAWLRYVAANRKKTAMDEAWDIVIGPVANDQTMTAITLYMDGFYDEQETIKRLLPQNLKDQYTFKTVAALAVLRCVEVITP